MQLNKIGTRGAPPPSKMQLAALAFLALCSTALAAAVPIRRTGRQFLSSGGAQASGNGNAFSGLGGFADSIFNFQSNGTSTSNNQLASGMGTSFGFGQGFARGPNGGNAFGNAQSDTTASGGSDVDPDTVDDPTTAGDASSVTEAQGNGMGISNRINRE